MDGIPYPVDLGRLIGGPYHRHRYVVDARQDRIVIAAPMRAAYWRSDLEGNLEVDVRDDHYRRERLTAAGARYSVTAFVHEGTTLEEATGLAFDLLVELALEPVLLEPQVGAGTVARVPVDVSPRLVGGELEAARALGEAAAGRFVAWARTRRDELDELALAGRL